MEFKELQDQITKIFLANLERDDIKISEGYLLTKLTEELGEFMQSYLIHKRDCRPSKYLSTEESKKEMAKELSDVLGLVFVIAKAFDLDIEEAITKKWITREWINKK
ncbi:hypothetical protein H8D36_02890 [archaeon]|nr:hypothetical protein [archaeon]MBL7057601.1 hypothetical protein [Candidatus Woesearchaeota archaeon]